MIAKRATVCIIDDDDATRTTMRALLDSLGLVSRAFSNAGDFLNHPRIDGPGCVLLDIRMPDMSGPALHDEMLRLGIDLPVIYVTGYADVATAVTAMQRGAIDVLEKPFRPEALMAAIEQAIARHEKRRQERAEVEELRRRFESLTSREKAVARLVVDGRTSREIGDELKISPRSVEAHRARIMSKTGSNSVVDLVRLFHVCRESL